MRKTSLTQLKAAYLLNTSLVEEVGTQEEIQSELSTLLDQESQHFAQGEILNGSILELSSHGVIVDIGYKSYGLIPQYEFSKHELEKLKAGDTLEVLLDYLEDEEGNVVVSYQKAKSMKAWDRIIDLAKNDQPVTGVVLNKVKGGLSVDIGVPAFLPGSQVDIQRVTDFDQFLGQEVICKILKINKKRGNVIISRRRHIEEERYENKAKVLATIEEGQILEGMAKNITNYGVFVDVGGVDGLLHITDMSWGRVNHPSELVKIGDSLTVKVIGLDREHEKISLGMKQLHENPWDNVEDRYPVGTKVKGTISSITDYGLFVEIEKGIEGLVHISEISWTERITNLSKHYHLGQSLEVVVVGLDKENRRMSLSIKQLTEDPWQSITKNFTVGDKISGRVSNVTDFGIFVEMGNGVDGLVHVSDISWTEHISHPSERYKKSTLIDAVILGLDPENRKISLGIKQLEKDPWQDVENLYPVGSVVTGTISKITNFGAFVKLESGIEGLIHTSELASANGEETLKENETREFKVIKVNQEERKLGLSIKALNESEEETRERKAPKEQNKKAPRQAQPTSTSTSSIKSVLQQALESHAARIKEEQSQDNNAEE